MYEYMEWGSLGRAFPLFGRTQRDLTAAPGNAKGEKRTGLYTVTGVLLNTDEYCNSD